MHCPMPAQNSLKIARHYLRYAMAGFCLAVLFLLVIPVNAQQSAPQDSILLAQQYPPQAPKRRTLFDLLFGNNRQQKQPEYTRPRVQQPQRRTSAPVKKKPVIAKPKPVIAPPPITETVAKNPDAKKILVIGDFTASSLSEGLNETFSQRPDVQIINRSNGSSGFVRQDYYNWNKQLPALLAEQKPAALVIMIGANDRQTMTQQDINAAPDTDEWKNLYQARVEAFLQVTAKSGIPVVWIGQPPYQSPGLSKTMLSLNAIYDAAAKQAVSQQAAKADKTTDASPQLVFADIWDGFVDDKGNFTQTGVDINGQTVRLRGNDGISMTAAGKRKLAFYAEKPLQRLLGLSAPEAANMPDNTAAERKSNERMAMPVQKEITRLAPVRISDLDQDNSGQLLGDTMPAEKTSQQYKAPKAAPLGRADNFHWPRP
ncbi:SGNH/GDSL hydrolase family protein [Pseudochrobactrum sp. HB0163]|uniref:SGNH/GDSL hydrolase family protein n=1 Tax=Pseudochrobactrum sp. HB0163 TaxID=3450708 RepID=UPI003F6E2680